MAFHQMVLTGPIRTAINLKINPLQMEKWILYFQWTSELLGDDENFSLDLQWYSIAIDKLEILHFKP